MSSNVQAIRVFLCLGFIAVTMLTWFRDGASPFFFFLLAAFVVFLVSLALVVRSERRVRGQ